MEELLDYDNLIYSIINKYSSKFDRDDLYQVSMVGLIEAFRNYKDNLNTKFSTYAYYYIIGEVNKYIRDSSSLKISKDVLKLSKSINKAKEVMSQRLGREPTNFEISLFLEVEEKKVEEALNISDIVSSLDFENENGTDLYNSIKIEDKSITADILDLKDEIMNLNEEERKIIIARYFDELTQVETSEFLGISQVQVSRKENKILEKLRCRL